jgi:hypothetical protein
MLGDIKRRRAKLEWLLGYAWFLGEAIRDQVAILPFTAILFPCQIFLLNFQSKAGSWLSKLA